MAVSTAFPTCMKKVEVAYCGERCTAPKLHWAWLWSAHGSTMMVLTVRATRRDSTLLSASLRDCGSFCSSYPGSKHQFPVNGNSTYLSATGFINFEWGKRVLRGCPLLC